MITDFAPTTANTHQDDLDLWLQLIAQLEDLGARASELARTSAA